MAFLHRCEAPLSKHGRLPAGRDRVPPRHPWWLLPHLLSLDAPLVAVAWQLLLAHTLAPVRPILTVLLGLAVWLVYVADRIFDSWTMPQPGESARHRFARDNRSPLAAAFGTVFVVAAFLSLRYLRPTQLAAGFAMLGAVAGYFAWTHWAAPRRPRTRWPKELIVGAIFAIGVWEPVLQAMPQWQWTHAAGFLLFGALCWWNCVAIEAWEQRHRTSAPSWHGSARWLSAHLTSSSAILALCGLLLFLVTQRAAPLAETFSALIFVVLAHTADRWPPDVLRVLVDLALLSPILLLVLVG